MQFTDTLEMIDEIQYAVERHVQGLRRVSANELGLDIRCGRAYVGENLDWKQTASAKLKRLTPNPKGVIIHTSTATKERNLWAHAA